MKQCVQFPDENILIVRPCLVAICAGNRPAAKLLGSLLFRGNLRIENKDDAKNLNTIKSSKGQTADQDTSTRIYRKQSQLVEDMCGEITEKTIHDVAVPWLQFLGYLDIQEFPGSNCYDVHFEAVQAALDVYVNNPRQLEKFLIDHLQLEKFLIDLKIEKFPIDKKSFLLVLEIILIANRNISNDKRGRKPTSEGSLGGISRRLKNLKEITKKDTEEQERESSPNTLDTHTIVSSDTAHAEYPLITFADCLSYLQEQGVAPRGEDAVQVMVQARTLYAHKHPRYEYRARPGLETHPDDQLPSQQNEQVLTNDVPQGDAHATAVSGHRSRVGEPAAPGVDGAGSPSQDRPLATPETRRVLEAQEEIAPKKGQTDGPDTACRDHRDSEPLHRTDSGASHSPLPAQTLTETPTTSTPAQSLPLPQAEQAALGAAQSAHGTHRTAPQAQPQGADSAKWNAQAMVAKACELRGKPFSDTARPKETKAAQKLFDRKPDLTEEEFERAFQQWNTQWWRETNGLFNLTDLAAVPKNKSEMRLIIALEKLALSKAITRQSGQIIPISGTKRYSSYDDPNFSSENDFYPVEGGSYAAASI